MKKRDKTNKNRYTNDDFIYGVYVRKSSETEDRQMQSLERQTDDLMEIKDKDRLTLISDPLQESQSAFSPGRVLFNRLVQMTCNGEVNAWLCWHLNRLSRNPVDAGMIIYLMDEGLLHHIKTPSRVFYNTPTDKMMLQIELTMSKKDSDDKSSFVKSGLKKRYKKGYPTGKAPIGFLNDKTKEKGDRGWFIDEVNFPKTKKLFERFLKGRDSVTSITQYAQEVLRIKTPLTKKQGGEVIGRSHVHHLLTSPVYAGFFYSKDEDGETVQRRALTQDIPRVISEDDHNKILNILGNKTVAKTQSHLRPFTGYLSSPVGDFIGVDAKFQVICDCKKKFAHRNKDACPSCGIKVASILHPQFLEYYYYYNVSRRKKPGVSSSGIREEKVTGFLSDYLKENLDLPPTLTAWAKKNLCQLKDAELEENQLKVQAYKEINEDKNKERSKLREMLRKEIITEEEYRIDLSQIEEKHKTQASTPEPIDWYSKIDDTISIGEHMQNILENGSVEQKREFMAKLGSNLVWDEENLSVINPKWLDIYIKGRKQVLSEKEWFEPRNNVGNKRENASFETLCPSLLRR